MKIKTYETFFYEENTHNISGKDNKKLIAYIEENLMWDFKDDNITYSIYGLFDFNYNNYKGLVIQIFRHDNNDSEIGFCFGSGGREVVNDDACPLYPMIVKFHQKLNSIIKCDYKIDSDNDSITISFNLLDSKINI